MAKGAPKAVGKRKGRPIDFTAAKQLLDETFALAEDDYREQEPINIPKSAIDATERVFASKTEAYRDSLPTCVIARILDPDIDIRLPATVYGENSFSGRSLSDNVVTPFLKGRSVPVITIPFLSALRGGAKFMAGGEPRIQRDPDGFKALVAVVDYVRSLNQEDAKNYFRYLLRRYIQLRESANIALRQIAKPNLEHLRRLINGLLTLRSGGRLPSFLATAMFQTINECHSLGWTVEFQGINVADKFTGAVGDITIRKGDTIILGVEVTERPIEIGRVTVVFDQKVTPTGLDDYLFISTATPRANAVAAAGSYTAVGHEMNFVDLAPWLFHNLSTLGPACRAIFQAKMIALIDGIDVPAEVKLGWNDKMTAAIGAAPSS